MGKTIVFILSPHISHIISTTRLARHLKNRGFDVVYVSTPSLKPAINRYGFNCYETTVKFIWNEDQDPLAIQELLRDIKRKFNPSLFFLEVGFWDTAIMLTGLSGKFIMVQSWACGDRCGFMPPFYVQKNLQSRNAWTYILNLIMWEWSNFRNSYLNLKFKIRYKQIVTVANVPPQNKYVSFRNRSAICRVLNIPELVLYPRELDFPRRTHCNTHFIGPFVDEERDEYPFDFSKIDLSRPLVVCSLGSLNHWFANADRFYTRVIEAFAICRKYSLVLNVGPHISRFKNVALPDNVHLYSSIPQLTLLKKAAFFVTHGGASSLKEAIIFGVPMLVYPWTIQSDMFENAKRIEYHHIGVVGDIEKDTAMDIVKRLEELNDERIRQGICRMRHVFARYRETEYREVDFIESIIKA